MAVYTHLDETALAALWSVYDDVDGIAKAEGIPHGSINTTYRLTTESGAVYYLRINEDKATDDVIYERDLLDLLGGAVVVTGAAVVGGAAAGGAAAAAVGGAVVGGVAAGGAAAGGAAAAAVGGAAVGGAAVGGAAAGGAPGGAAAGGAAAAAVGGAVVGGVAAGGAAAGGAAAAVVGGVAAGRAAAGGAAAAVVGGAVVGGTAAGGAVVGGAVVGGAVVEGAAVTPSVVVTPVIKRTRIGGSFFLVEQRRGKPVWAEVFPALPGRDLGVFEVTAAHTAQLGAFLARAHRRLRGFHGGRPNPYGLPVVARWLQTLPHEVTPRLRALVAHLRRQRRPLPRGVVHGDLFVDNTKWSSSSSPSSSACLVAVFDWEMAGRDHMALDLAVCLHAWCWRRQETRYDVESARALLAAYQRERPFTRSERRGFFVEALFAAVRFTASRVRDFEVPRERAHRAERAYLDYRDFLARVDALEGMGDSAFRTMVGLT